MRVVTKLDIFDKRASGVPRFENLDGIGDTKKSQVNFNIRSEDGSVADHMDERLTNLSSDTNMKSLGRLRLVQKIFFFYRWCQKWRRLLIFDEIEV